MKRFLLIPAIVVLAACTPKSEQTDDPWAENNSDSTIQILYNQVMDVHDEVMPRMEDIYNLKKDIQEKMTNEPGMPESEKKALQARINHLDSVSNLMMEWMHQFNPPADTADQEQSRAYLESEMEKIRKVKDAMLEAIEAK